MRFEKGDPAWTSLQQALRAAGVEVMADFVPAFEEWEVEAAELLNVDPWAFCGEGFARSAKKAGRPAGSRVMDKGAMRHKDIARTSGREIIISERLRLLFLEEGLSGWEAHPVRHVDPEEDRYPPFYHLVAVNTLPALEPETELFTIKLHGAVWPVPPVGGDGRG